jgi:hypothetical protein
MEEERLKKIILEIYTGQVNLQDAVDLVCEYMIKTKGSINQPLLQYITNQMDPFAMQMFQTAVDVSKKYFEATTVTITRVMYTDGRFIYAF